MVVDFGTLLTLFFAASAQILVMVVLFGVWRTLTNVFKSG